MVSLFVSVIAFAINLICCISISKKIGGFWKIFFFSILGVAYQVKKYFSSDKDSVESTESISETCADMYTPSPEDKRNPLYIFLFLLPSAVAVALAVILN